MWLPRNEDFGIGYLIESEGKITLKDCQESHARFTTSGGGGVFVAFNFSTSSIPIKSVLLDSYFSQLNHKTVSVRQSGFDFTAANLDVNAILANLGDLVDLKYNDPFPNYHEHIKKSAIPFSIPLRTAQCIRRSNSIYGLQLIEIRNKGKHKLYTAISQSTQYPQGLEFKVFKDQECSPLKAFVLVQYSLGWLRISEVPIKLAFNRPGRLTNLGHNSLIYSSAEGDFFSISKGKILTKLKSNKEIFGNPYQNINGGVKSILVKNNMLFVAWANGNPKCQRIQVYGAPLQITSVMKFRKIFENSPCSPRNLNRDRSYLSEMAAIGGRLISFDSSSMLLSVGTPNLWRGDEPVSLDSNLGRIVRLDTRTKKISTFSTGHRNTQGMCISGGKIYEVEQGPQGGDEFNLITYGGNYGWPKNSFGRPYGPLVETQTIFGGKTRYYGSHRYGIQPLYSWVPSIAVSPLLCPLADSNSEIRSSFWIGTLKDESIHRVRLSNTGSVLLDEKIDLGTRVREILPKEDDSGFWILTDTNRILDFSFT